MAARPLLLVLPWVCFMSYIQLNQWLLIQILLAAFLSNAFSLMFYHVLINMTLLLTLYLSLIYSWLCICLQLKDISLNVIMGCDSKSSTISVRSLCPAVIKVSDFFLNHKNIILSPVNSCLPCRSGFTYLQWNWNKWGKVFYCHMNKRPAVLKGCSHLQSILVDSDNLVMAPKWNCLNSQ